MIVNEQNARRLSQPRPDPKAARKDPRQQQAAPAAGNTAAQAEAQASGDKKQVRSVGPTFLPQQQQQPR